MGEFAINHDAYREVCCKFASARLLQRFSKDYFEESVDTYDVNKVRSLTTSTLAIFFYHRFSHGAVSYTLNGKTVNVMLESAIIPG